MLVKAYWEDRQADPIVKYVPGDSIPDDHPKRDWLLRSKIAVAEDVPAGDAPEDAEVVTAGQDDDDDDVAAPVDEPAVTGKPKPTDSVEKHREFLKKHGVDPKGLTRPQLVKAVAAIDV